jgi:hypothetical protein
MAACCAGEVGSAQQCAACIYHNSVLHVYITTVCCMYLSQQCAACITCTCIAVLARPSCARRACAAHQQPPTPQHVLASSLLLLLATQCVVHSFACDAATSEVCGLLFARDVRRGGDTLFAACWGGALLTWPDDEQELVTAAKAYEGHVEDVIALAAHTSRQLLASGTWRNLSLIYTPYMPIPIHGMETMAQGLARAF